MMVLVGNGMCYGGGMFIMLDVLYDDGLLDVLVVGLMFVLWLLIVFFKVFSGSYVMYLKVMIWCVWYVWL